MQPILIVLMYLALVFCALSILLVFKNVKTNGDSQKPLTTLYFSSAVLVLIVLSGKLCFDIMGSLQHYYEGTSLFNRGDYKGAIVEFKKVSPADWRTYARARSMAKASLGCIESRYQWRAEFHYKKGNFKQAQSLAKKALEINPKNAQAKKILSACKTNKASTLKPDPNKHR